jgi:signal transduction histidine kinase
MRFHALVPLTAALANLLIGALVARQGLRDRLHRAFTANVLTIVAWNLGIFSLYYFDEARQAEWWSRLFRVGICFAPATTFHFALVLSESRGRLWRVLLSGAYLIAALLALANLAGWLVRGVTPHTWGWYVDPAPLYGVLAGMLVTCLLLWGERVWWTYRHPSSPRQGAQARFWLLAGVVQIPFALTNLLPIYGIEVYPLGNAGNVFYTGIVAYAMVRHRLMDVDYVVRKGVSFTVAVAVALVPGGAALAVLLRAVGIDQPVPFVCAALALALVAVLLAPTLQAALETRVHRALFPTVYDHRRRLRELTSELVHVLDQTELAQRLGSALAESLDVERCDVFVVDDQLRQLGRTFSTDSEPADTPDIAVLDGLVEPVLATELERSNAAMAALCRRNGWEVVIPLCVRDRLVGLVALGRTRDLRIFSVEDLDLLASLAGAATIALENGRLARQLRRSEGVLERANRLSSLGTLAAGIAHEIRNPLVAVKTFLDLLPERLDDRDFVTNFRTLSLNELQRVSKLISDLLSLGKSPVAGRRAVTIEEALDPVVRLMGSTAHKRRVELEAEFAPGLPPVSADPDQLKQIALNLILNAIEASPSGTRVRVVVASGHHPTGAPLVLIDVHDEGPGIPAGELEHIFLPFYTTKDSGTGLGLALVHQMVVDHGGEITVDSAPGRGTVFRVSLPAAELARTGTDR